MSTFCQILQRRKCQRRGLDGQKTQNLVNAVKECVQNNHFRGRVQKFGIKY